MKHISIFVAAIVVTGVVAGITLVPLARTKPIQLGQSNDIRAITETITADFALREEACLWVNRNNVAQFISQLGQYVDSATPDPIESATSGAYWAEEHATQDPAVAATADAEALADYLAGLIDEKELLSPPYNPTPWWYPGDSSLDNASARLDQCLARQGPTSYKFVGSGGVSVSDPDFSIIGNSAEGTVRIQWWGDTEYPDGSIERRSNDRRWIYSLRRDSTGVWKTTGRDIIEDGPGG